MTLVLATPVAHRAWILPRWYECIAAQTVRPDAYVFVHGGDDHDETWKACWAGIATVNGVGCVSNVPGPTHQRHDNSRFATLARLRDLAIERARWAFEATRVLSLDTDVLLEDPTTIDRLMAELDAGADVAAPATWLQPTVVDPEVGGWAVNAFRFNVDGAANCYTRAFHRLEREETASTEPVPVDFTAAVQMFGPRVIASCRYQTHPHESGEDISFGMALEGIGARVSWLPYIHARHVWSEAAL